MTTQYTNAAEMLPLPRVAILSESRRDGQECVWCGDEPSLSLGLRIAVIRGVLNRFAPRACQSCARREAARVLAVHVRTCQKCAGRRYCVDALALSKLAHDGATS